MSAADDQLQQLKLIAGDVADAGGAPHIDYMAVETDDGYIATVEAPEEN